MSYGLKIGVCLVGFFFALSAVADPFPPEWQSGAGAAVHYQPIAWPAEPADAKDCGTTCGDWQPYTRFQNDLADARNKDTSNGGTAPQSYVNVSSSCDDRSLPSIYYALYQGATEADDVLMFRWRVEAPAHNYATGPNAGRASAGNPWSSALWTVFFDIEGSGFRSLAAHLDGSVGSPGQEVDILAGIWGESASHSLDYANDPYVHLLGHNPTAFTGASGGILNFQNSLSPLDSWPNGSAETSWDYGTTRAKLVSKNSCNEYFVDYQIPVAMLDASALGGPKITRSTPIAMMFCTANSLNNPLQKDCAISKNWVADTGTVGPFGDYLSFNQTEPYSQPIIAEINATPPASCPGSYKLQARVQDTLALQNGSVVTSVQAVEFFYWFDRNGDGEATTADTGSTWIKADDATLVDGTLNTWTGTWDSAGVPKGQYLIAAQALDDNLLVDDGMTPSGIDNRTFSYLSGDSANHIYVGGAWAAGQQAVFPDHSPTLTPIVSENWYGNPDVTGSQVAVIGTAINICGLAPAVSQSVDKTEVGVGDTVEFTISISNPAGAADPLAVNQFVNTLPDGFSYVASSASGATTNEPAVSGQVLTWSLSPSIAVSPGSSLTLTFEAMAASDAGVYNNQASVVSDFGVQIPEPLAVMVDAPRVSLKLTPSAYSIAADGVTELTYTGTYTNESNVTVYGTSLTTDLLADTSYVGCTGGSTCAEAAGTVTWSLGDLAPGATGSASLTITVADTWASTSLSQALDLAATDAAANPVSATATTTVAVTGVNVVSPAAFSLRKSASEIQVAPGDSLTYTLNYNNYGGTAATDVVLTDTLPAGVTYSSCTGGCDQIASTVTWNLGTIAAGASGSVSVTVAVASPFTAPNPAVNTASINWSGGVAVGTSADVGITGQACNTYYFSDTTGDVGASGNQKLALLSPVPTAATTGSSVTVTAPSVSTATFSTPLSFFQDPATTSDVPFSGNITTNIYIDRSNGPALNLRASVYDYDSATGTQTLLGQNDPLSDGQYNGSSKGLLSVSVPTSGTLSKGHRLLWTFEAQSNHNSNTYSVQFQYGGTVANTVSGSGTTAALSGASFCVTPPANLLVSESASENQLTGGATDQVVFTVQYANTGAADADNATLINALPSGFTNCEYSMDNSNWASCSDSVTPAHTFSLGTLAGGASGAVYLRGNAPAGSVGGDTLTASASIVSDQTTEKTATAAIEVLSAGGGGTAELALLMSADKNGLVPGESVTYTLTVINIGGVSATNVEINNTLPVADYFSYTMCSNGCSHVGNDLSWAIGTLAAGASQAVSYTMTVGATNLTAGISAIDDDALASGDGLSDAASNTVTVYLSGNPQLSIAGSASPNAGLAPKATTAYSWSVTNNGSVSATAVQVIVPIPGELEYAGNASASVGSARFDGVNNEVILTAGDLVAGASAVLSFNARVLPVIASGTTVITATGTASASNAQASSANVLVSATAAASFNLVQNVSGGSAYPAALLTASATSTTEIEVDKPENFGLGQKVMIGAAVATVVATSATTITLDQAVTAPDSTAVVGGLRYLINYQHTGDATAINAVLNQVLPTGIEYYLATPAPASAPSVGSNGTLIWNLGDLSPGHTGGFEVWAFPSGDPGAFTITATLEADNADTETASVESLIGGLTLAKATSTPQVVAGSTVSYSITLSNSLGSAISPVRVDDQLPPGFSYRTGTASVGGIASEPDFAIDDTAFSNPFWDNLTVPAGAELLIEFDADVDADAGAGVYQNTLSATAPATVGLQAYDTLARGDDDVTVLASDQATVTGIVFHRTSATGTSYVPGEDSPLESVQVEIYQNGADCSDLYAPDCYIVYTDADGRFAQVVTSGTWAINVVTGSGELDGAWPQRVGSNDDTYSLAALEVVADQNGFGELTGTSIVTDVDIATDEDMPYTFAAAAFIAAFTDTNGGDALQTLRIDSLPEHGILTLAATPVVVNETLAVSDIANLVYTPGVDYNGADSFGWNATDGLAYDSSAALVNITVNPVADPSESTIVDINKTLDEDTALTFAASDFSTALNDSSGGSNLVRIRIDALPEHGALTLNNSAVLVNAEIDAADIANLVYTPVADYNGTDAFAWNAFDGAVYAAANASVNLTITPVADSNESTIVDINKTLDEDTALTFAASDFSAALNDSSGGSNLVRIRIDALPEHGALTLNNSAVLVSAEIDAADIANLVYTPVADYNGTDTFAWNAFDGAVYAAANASVNLTITPVADPGEVVAANFAKAIAEDTVLAFSVEDFTSHFTDASGGAALVTLRVDALPDKGVLRLAGVNVTLNQAIPVNLLDSLTYTPEANYAGADQWQWNGSDGTAFASASAEVAITITEVTDPIAAFDFELQLLEDTPFTFTATHFDDHFDAGADALPLTYVAVATLPAAGVLSLYGFPVEAGDSLLRVDLDFLLYTPTAEYFGEDDFTWRAGNGEVWSEAATITFNIANVVDLGAVMEFAIELDEDTEYVFSASEFTAHYSNEIEQTELATVRVTQLPSHGNLYLFNVMVSPNTDIQVADLVELVYVPAEDYAGADRFDWNGSDGNAFAAAGASVQITVHPVADPGEAADIVRQLDEDSSLRSEPEWFTQAFAAGETETDLVSVRVDSLPNHGTLTLRGVPVTVGQVITLADWSNVIYQPEAEFSGDDGFAWSGFDGTLYSANGARVILQVLEINDGPVSADEEITLAQGETATIDVLSGAYDNDNDVLTVVSAYSDFGTVTIVNNQLVFLPDAKFSGVAQITYLISDGKGGLSESTVIVNVLGNGDEPALEVPEDKFESATALYTKIDLGVARAEDRFGNPLPVSLVDGVTFFEPGINRVFWQAVDVDGNRRVEMQEVKVRPLISVEKDQRMLEGRRGRIGVYLNGASPEYPLAIPYTVTGTASVSDHNLRSGTLVIRAGLEGYIEFDVFSDGSTDANETLIVTLDPTNNRGNRFEHKVTITEGNVAPVVTVFGEQNGDKRLTFSRDESEGQAVLKAMVFDDNPEDTHTWQWLTPGHETPDLDTDVSQFTLDPQSMIAGLYTFEVSVTDSGTPALMQNQRVYIEIVDRLAPIADGLADFDRDLIPDAVEGYGDDDGDGIPNYADSRDECNVLHEEIIDQDGYLIEGEPGVCLRRGFFTAQGESGGALITDGDVAVQRNALTPDPDADNVCGVFDYIGYGLPEAGQSYHIVMPQRKPIPANAVYRKFMNGQWGFFVEDESNSIASAPGEQGFCPPPGGAVWQPGLTPGHWCVQLTVADGGPNDDDGVANGTVVDPGGVAVLKSINQAPVSEDFGIQGDAGANVVLSPLEHTDDPDGDALTVINASATFGTVTINADNTLTLMPPAEYLGEILVTYTVSDGRGGISVANISVEVAVAAASTPVRLRTRGGAFGGVELTFLVGFLAFGICLRRGSRRARLSLGLGLIAMFSTFQAQADNEPTADGFEPHFFVSGRLGLARSLTTTGELERRFDRIGYNIDVTHIDRLDMGYALGIGYQFRDHWAVVGGGAHLGEFAIDLEGELDDEEAFYRAAETLHPESAKGLFAALQYQVPFGERWRASFRLGALSWKGEYSTHLLDMGGQEVGDDRQSGTDLYLGGGVALALDRRWSIDAGWERYFFDNHDVDFWSLGLSYRFGFRKQDSPVASKPQPQEPPQWLPIEEPVPEKLNEQSCQMFTGSLHGVNFESASAKLTAEAIETLVLVKSVLDEFPDITIAIAAHTDSIGSEASNLALAQARAESVRDFLIAHDILPERLHAEGFGEKRPIASNDTPQGRAENRRVEIRLVEDGKHNCDE